MARDLHHMLVALYVLSLSVFLCVTPKNMQYIAQTIQHWVGELATASYTLLT